MMGLPNSASTRWVLILTAGFVLLSAFIWGINIQLFALVKAEPCSPKLALRKDSLSPTETPSQKRIDIAVTESPTVSPTFHEKREDGLAVVGVRLVHDRLWFDRQTKAGCCPYAVELYEHRYGGPEYFRCCTNRLDEIEPWRPVFTTGSDQATTDENRFLLTQLDFLKDASILIQGDSLAEQHFIGMLCYFWAHNDTLQVGKLELIQKKDPFFLAVGTTWRVALKHPLDPSWNATLTYVRWNKLGGQPVHSHYSHVIVGGWHHGDVTQLTLIPFLRRVINQRNSVDQHTFVTQALPSHFPGGEYRVDNKYRPPVVWGNLTSNYNQINTSTPALCDSFALHTGDPNVNVYLTNWKRKLQNSSVAIIEAAHLLRHRGEAHIGDRPEGNVGKKGRDCLHWCVVPGVLDGLAMQTLATLHNHHHNTN